MKKYKLQILGSVFASVISFGFAAPAMAVPSLQIGDADGGVCDSYDSFSDDCLVGELFSVTSSEAGAAYLVFGAVPKVNTDTFTLAPSGDSGALSLVQSGFGSPPLEDPNSLAPHGIFETYFEVYRFDFDNTATTIFNTEPGNPGDSALGYIEYMDMNLSSLTDGLHIDLFRCSTGSVEAGDCMIKSGQDFAPFSHDATYVVPVPAAVWLFGSGLLGLVAVSRRKA